MRAAIYNPYLDTLGGGERYTASVAKVLSENGYEVDLEWKDAAIKKSLESRFGLELKKINVVESVERGDGYDLCFWVSDGSVPALKARRNYLHFQVPFTGVGGRSLLNKMKLYRVNKIICNSKFTKSFIDQEFGVDSMVLYPPVDVAKIIPRKKENKIMYLGRFSTLLQKKNQDVLITAFKKFYNQGHKNWKLVLAGGVEVGGEEYLESLKKESEGYPITFMESPSFGKVVEIYGKSKIFWSAVGTEVDEMLEPSRVEHFGMSVVEAMAAGAVPMLPSKGGYKEIVEDGVSGNFWETEEDLIRKTADISENQKKREFLAKAGVKRSKEFSYEVFARELVNIINL